jgi:Uma2 family endonuclease
MAIERATKTDKIGPNASELPADGPTPRLFTVDEYYKMAEVGILSPREHVELIGGVIYRMNPIGPRHHSDVIRLNRVFTRRLLTVAEVSVQGPVRLASMAEPEPDFAILRQQPDQRRPYAEGHAMASDVYFLVEIADTSLSFDLSTKAEAYARDGISELWVLDLTGDRLIVHRAPGETGYSEVRSLIRGDEISPLAFPSVTFTVDEILG